MKKLVSANSLLALALCLSGTAALGQNAQPPLANDDVVQMVVNGLPQSIIVGAISANNVNFDVSTSGLLSIRKAGVGDQVIEAMLAAQAKNREAAAPRGAIAAQQQTPAQLQAAYLPAELTGAMEKMHAFDKRTSPVATEMPKVTLVVGDKKQPMQPSTTEIANAKGQGGSTAGGILKGFGKGVLMVGSMTGAPVPHGGRGGPAIPGVAHTWALPGRTSPFAIPTVIPKFEIEFADIPGVDPDAYEAVLVKLIQTKDNWRLVSSSKDKFDKHGNDTRSVKTEDKTPVNITVLGRGHLEVSPSSQLAPGEYGLVLNPKKSVKELAGTPANNTEAIFSSVWDFSVRADR